jgi:hypothetical protein
MPFAIDTSAKYEPLRAEDFRATLYGLRFKRKSSPLAQIADLYLYPICRGRYEPDYAPYMILRDRQKLINSTLEDDSIEQCGIKYSCFELVDARNTKAGGDPGFSAAPR